MVKRIVIAFLMYILIMLFFVFKSRNNAFYTIFFSGVFFIYIFWEFFSLYNTDWKKNNNPVIYDDLQQENIDTAQLKKISSRPFLLGVEKKFISDESFYFDNKNLYIADKNNKIVKIVPFDRVMELKKTSVNINNIRIWQLTVRIENENKIFRFANNYRIWNENFKEFYYKLLAENPNAVKTKWSFWNL